jgi:hypothetical protein
VNVDLASAQAVADTVLFEGYMLYPYRANDAKNQVRWQFGVLAPPAFADLDPSERSWLRTECVLEGQDVTLTVRVRFLQVQRRVVEARTSDGFRRVERLDVGDATYLPWDEAVVCETDEAFRLPGLDTVSAERVRTVDGGIDVEELTAGGAVVGRLVRERLRLTARVRVEAELLPGPFGVRRLRVRVENGTPWTPPVGPRRPDALCRALVAAHLLLEADGGAFVSQLDPPEWARGYVAGCDPVGAFPVLAGTSDTRNLMLASPIILYDYPQVAPESASTFCDATEMDEMLTLRTLTLTDEEKRQVRGSDPRAAELMEQLDHLPPELLDRLHGTIRSMNGLAEQAQPAETSPWWDPERDAEFDPDTDVVLIGGVPVGKGSPVTLRPGSKRADAQDMFLDGRPATVAAVLFDVDGSTHLAVSLDDLDSLADGVFHPHGRFLYFAPDEVEPIGMSR